VESLLDFIYKVVETISNCMFCLEVGPPNFPVFPLPQAYGVSDLHLTQRVIKPRVYVLNDVKIRRSPVSLGYCSWKHI